jgi:hypothetical protein
VDGHGDGTHIPPHGHESQGGDEVNDALPELARGEKILTATEPMKLPYRPNFIHAFYGWLDRLPLPDWLMLAILIPLVGLAQHLVAWSRGLLMESEFSYDLGTAGIYLGGYFLGIYALKGAPKALDEYRPLLKVSDEEYSLLNYRFVFIPGRLGTIFFLIGALLGVIMGFSDMAVAPAVDYAFPLLRMAIWATGSGITFLFGYQIIRQLRQIDEFYAMLKQIDLFNPRPLYGFSKYTATLGVFVFFVLGLSIIDPTAYAAFSGAGLVVCFTAFALPTLLIFYLPLAGAHRQLVAEKDRLLQEANLRIETMLERLHAAALEQQDYKEVRACVRSCRR